MLVRVVSSYFVAGLIFEHGYVVQAAPILKWMGPQRGHAKGMSESGVREYIKHRGWKATIVKETRE